MAGKVKFPVAVVLSAVDRATGPLSRSFGKISRGARQVTRAIERAALVGGGALLGMTATAAYAAKRLTISYAREADELGKFARQIGMTAESIQELRFAAQRQGAGGAAELDKALEMMARRLGEARAGTGQLASFLKRIDPALLRAARAAKSNDEAFNLFADALARTRDPAKRTALATAIFGRAGAKMARLVDGGTEALAALREEARRYGLVTQEQAREAEAFQDAQENLAWAIRGVKIAIGSELLPVLRPLLDGLRDWIAANRAIIRARIQDVIKQMVEKARGAWEWLETAGPRVWNQISGAVATAVATFKDFLRNIESAKTAIETLATVYIAGKLYQALTAISRHPAFAVIAAAAAVWMERAQAEEYRKRMAAMVGGRERVIVAEEGIKIPPAYRGGMGLHGMGVFGGARREPTARERLEALRAEHEAEAAAARAAAPIMETLLDFLRGGPVTEVGGEVVLRFENAPPEMRVETVRTENARVPLTVKVGPRGVGTGRP